MLSIRYLLAILLLLLGVNAAAGGGRTMDYAWLLFLKVNEPPHVDAGNNQGISGDTADLSASVIDDPKDTLTYAWAKVSGPGSVWFDNASAKQTLVTFSASGAYTLKFTADDGEFESSDTVIITVTNTSPNVNAGGDKQITHPTNSVTLSGSVSDGENNVEGIAWSKVSGPGGVTFSNPSNANTGVTFSSGAVGTYVLRLSASDWEFTSTDTVTVDYLPQPVTKIDVIVAVGDSITVGFGDSDCVYQNAKACSGYTPRLKSKLAGTAKYASGLIIQERGTGGKTSAYGLSVIDGIISDHPYADQYLVMYGTNDAQPNPPPSKATFKYNMRRIAEKINAVRGMNPILAKAPYAKGDEAYRNVAIQQYNQAVQELYQEKSFITISPPDFYTYFKNHQDQIWSYYMFNDLLGTSYTDNLHPRSSGYDAMANIWFNQLK